VLSAFPELDFFIHGTGTELDVLSSLSTSDILIAASGGLSRFASILTSGLVLAPKSSAYPLHARTVYGKRTIIDDKITSSSSSSSSTSSSSNNENSFLKYIPIYQNILLVDAIHLFNIGNGIVLSNNINKIKQLYSSIIIAKKSKLVYEGGIWLEENVLKNLNSIRFDPLQNNQNINGNNQNQNQNNNNGIHKILNIRDKCIKNAVFNTQSFKHSKCQKDIQWWKCVNSQTN